MAVDWLAFGAIFLSVPFGNKWIFGGDFAAFGAELAGWRVGRIGGVWGCGEEATEENPESQDIRETFMDCE